MRGEGGDREVEEGRWGGGSLQIHGYTNENNNNMLLC